MIVYLAGFNKMKNVYNKDTSDIYLLSSFFWERKTGEVPIHVLQDKHILDSGAFTAINDKTGKYKNLDWLEYCKKYIKFINQTNQHLFFELDVDCVAGLEKVEYMRKMIEDGTGKQPIPVWHPNRKWDYFLKMCEEYPYVSVGLNDHIQRLKPKVTIPIYKKFIDAAHQKGVKIHGLGFTQTQILKFLHFDSVDSTSWNNGSKYGQVSIFTHNCIIYRARKGKRVIDWKEISIYNFNKWIQYQQWALTNL